MQETLTAHSKTLETLILGLPEIYPAHEPSSDVYKLLHKLAVCEAEARFSGDTLEPKDFGPFGSLVFPYFQMGAINSVNLFALDELIIFSFYYLNRNRYKNVLDIGGNIGLHSIVMARCGFNVTTFEPDVTHYEKLSEMLKLNECTNVTPLQEAVSSSTGTAEFVRVLGNTTSSHLAGSKNPYGDLETYEVPIRDIRELLDGIDLIKMDAEGHEKEILLAMNKQAFNTCDVMVEIGSPENAEAVFEHLKREGITAFAQKISWEKVERYDDMPESHRHGSLFITNKDRMPWRN
ncbi:MAG: hypothetical protein SP1CHLAM54_15300 [Chlamydiia bacterium]|nr:hypothetical protein [Chlamydiia bacterium]MCH9616420.1 hypothetical protein [Chlamydiia bacterium]MCH9629594.1 hypothetical protein [Chlamydiia bacterium]